MPPKRKASPSPGPRGASKSKYPWGNLAFDMKLMPAFVAFGAVLTAAVMATIKPSGGPAISVREMKGPVLVTLVWIHAIQNAMCGQLLVKFGSHVLKTKAKKDRAMHVADRSLYNSLEQAFPFLLLMWLMVIFVDCGVATYLGAFYVAVRMLYPVAYSYYGEFSMLVELITQPNYMVVFYYKLSLLYFCLPFGGTLESNLPQKWLGRFVVSFMLFFFGQGFDFFYMWRIPAGFLAAKLNLSANKG